MSTIHVFDRETTSTNIQWIFNSFNNRHSDKMSGRQAHLPLINEVVVRDQLIDFASEEPGVRSMSNPGLARIKPRGSA